jgi:hypothetical protein
MTSAIVKKLFSDNFDYISDNVEKLRSDYFDDSDNEKATFRQF